MGKVVIKNMFGHSVKTITNANPKESLALIGQTRLFQTCISTGQQVSKIYGRVASEPVCEGSELLPGYYTAHLTAHYGINSSTAQAVTATASFWYIPWWSIITVIIIIGALGGAGWYGYRRYKRQSVKR
jgi:hypothetical protein